MDYFDHEVVGLAVAVGIGLLVGLQREWVADKPIGLRSFALISLIGGLAGLFATDHGVWILASGLLVVALAVLAHTHFVARNGETPGMTTQLAAIVVYLIGALATSGYVAIAVVLGGGVTVLLHWKGAMHSTVERIGEVEFQAIARFVLITLVVLPVLPDRSFGPFAVLNPWQIWLMVVLIVSLNLAGYVWLKIATGRVGTVLSGILGGLISSTATTVSFSSRSREQARIAPVAAVVILVASALVYVRVLIEVAVVAPALVPDLIVPLTVFLVLMIVVISAFVFRLPDASEEPLESRNPAQLSAAVTFGLLYSGVLFVSAAVNDRFGETMLYPVAVLSGLTDVDAITLSIGRLYATDLVESDAAWRIIFVASLSNLAFKAGVVAILGSSQLRARLLPAMAGLTGVGLLGVWLWP